MSTTFASGLELTLVIATAVSISLAGMWLSRRFAVDPERARGSAAPAFAPKRGPLGARRIVSMPPPPAARTRSPVREQRSGRHAGAAQAVIYGLGEILTRAIAWLEAAPVEVVRASARRFGKSSHASCSSARTAAALATLPQRLTQEAQWERTAESVGRAVSGAHTLRTAHACASDKLDAAHYALERLMRDLEGVISSPRVPAKVAVLPRASNVVSMRYTRPDATRAAA